MNQSGEEEPPLSSKDEILKLIINYLALRSSLSKRVRVAEGTPINST